MLIGSGVKAKYTITHTLRYLLNKNAKQIMTKIWQIYKHMFMNFDF